MRPLFTGLVLATATVITATGVRATSQDPQERPDRGQGAKGRPTVAQSVRHDVSQPLRDVRPHEPKAKRDPHPPLPLRQPRQKTRLLDPVLQTSTPIIAAPPTLFNFEGVNNVDSVLPPDTNGDIGPNHYVQWVNKTFAIYDRAGTVLYGPAAGSTIWDGFGGPCETQNDGDPIVLYDHLADRWLMTQFALPNNFFGLLFAPFYQCIAVSQTGDPTGAYYRYAYEFSKLNDYPKFGVWPDAYYMAINQFAAGSLTFAGQGVTAFNRAAMLNGQPAAMVYFDLASVDPNLGGMLPSDLDGPPPPAGSPNVYAEADDDAQGYSGDQLQLWRFAVDWSNPSNSTFTKASSLPVAAFDGNLCSQTRACIPQPGTTAKLDALADRLMYRLQYRNFGTHESLVVNHTVDVDGNDHAGVRWYEVRDPNGTPFIYQQGTFAPDALHRWMASAAMDSAGNLALAYNAGGSTLSPSIRYTARLNSDPLGVMGQGENDLIHGSGSQTHTASRWGDYSMLTVDPVDGCTFWATAEYMAVTSLAGWQTRIGAFRLPNCGTQGPPPDAPLGLTATTASSKRVNLAWSDQSTSEDGFRIERCSGTAGACNASGTFALVGQTAAGATTYADNGLVPSTTYSYRVRSFNAGGSSDPTNTAEATTLAPPSISVTATTATANEAGPVNGVFTIARNGQFESPLAVAFTISGTAVKGTDYQNPVVSVTIPVGQPSATVTIVPINDTTIEQPETVVLTLTSGTDYTIGTASSTVTIVSDDLSIDFVVTALTVPAVVAVGSTFDVTEATKNQGNDTAPPSSTSFTVSVNYVLDSNDKLVGARTVPELLAGTSNSATASVTLPSSIGAGTYALFAKADAQSQFTEASEYNNTRTATLKVGPDLAVTTVTAPAIVAPGVAFAVTDVTKNQGAGLAAASTTKFYLSANALYDGNDTPLQSRGVGPLDTGISSSGTTMLTLPADTVAGTYYIIGVADDGAVVTEHTETNNSRVDSVSVGGDLIVTTLTAPLKVASGGVISVSDTVKNNGAAAMPASTTAFYVSANAALDGTDTRIELTRAVPALGAGLSSNGVTSVTLPTLAPGTWYLVAKADDPAALAEASETNNTRFTTLQVGPDLTMYSLTVPATATMGSSITVTDAVRNQGGDVAGASTTKFYLSLNAAFDTSDIPIVGGRAVGELGINLTSSGTTLLTLPQGVSGKYYLLAVADGTTTVMEAIETNNVVARLITISQ
jgi:CARDB protein/fibronectin type III domain protein